MEKKPTSYMEQSKYWMYQILGNKKNIWEIIEETDERVRLSYRGRIDYSLYSEIEVPHRLDHYVSHGLFRMRYKPLKNDLYDTI